MAPGDFATHPPALADGSVTMCMAFLTGPNPAPENGRLPRGLQQLEWLENVGLFNLCLENEGLPNDLQQLDSLESMSLINLHLENKS